MSGTGLFEWHKRLVVDRKNVEVDQRSGRPCTSPTKCNIEKVLLLVGSDHCLTIDVTANEL